MKIKNLPPRLIGGRATTYNLKPNKGFTLVEMLVAISTFMVVMLVAAGSLVSIIDGSNKAQSLKSAINNLNFALESMGKNIRVGTGYSGETCSSLDSSCAGISFKSYKNDEYITYRFNNEAIERCIGVSSVCSSGSTFTRLTAPEVKITDMKFYIRGNVPQRVLITISGEAGNKERLKTKFNLQTTVAQRSI